MRKLENSELDRKSVADFKKSEKTPLILVLDDIRSLHNIGSVFRTADAFLIKKIYLCGITAIPPHKEINKTALQDYLNQLPSNKTRMLYFGFAKESSFDTYLQYQIFIKGLQYNGFDANAPRQEFIF